MLVCNISFGMVQYNRMDGNVTHKEPCDYLLVYIAWSVCEYEAWTATHTSQGGVHSIVKLNATYDKNKYTFYIKDH